MAKVVLENIYKSFPHREGVAKSTNQGNAPDSEGTSILRRINLTVADGEFMVLVGPSGCGKSTLLRLIAGLETITGGNVWIGDRLINQLPPKQRDIAMVFQNYALYPHMTVYDNIAFGLRRRDAGEKKPENSALSRFTQNTLTGLTKKLPKGLRYISEDERGIRERVKNVAQLLQMETLLNRLPKQLSGGQRQRVALGRAIARNPQVFLMDEPLSNLDAKLRTETRAQIVKLQRQLGTTTIYVTHDQTEAMTMGDRIAILNQGQLQQVAAPLELYNHPTNLFVAQFIGSPAMNLIPVEFHAPHLITSGDFRMTLPEVWGNTLQKYDGRTLILGIRPEHFAVSLPATKNLPVKIELVENLGNDTYLAISLVLPSRTMHPLGSDAMQIRVPPERHYRMGEEIWLSLTPDKLYFFDPETELAIYPKIPVMLPFEK